jgi:hypothetical protein
MFTYFPHSHLLPYMLLRFFFPFDSTMAPRVKDLTWMRNRFLFAVRAAVEQVFYVM